MVWSHNDGLADQPTYWVQHGAAEPVVLLDPNTLSDDGAVAVVGSALSDDGRLFAYLLAEAGSDRQQLAIRRTDSGEDLADRLDHLRFTSIAWLGDGFFYVRWPETKPGSTAPVKDPSVHYHRIGTEQADDPLVFRNDDDPEPIYMVELTEDLRYLVLADVLGTDRRNGLLYLDLAVHGDTISSGGTVDPAAWVRLVERVSPPTTSCSMLPTATTAAFSFRPTATPRTGASSPSILRRLIPSRGSRWWRRPSMRSSGRRLSRVSCCSTTSSRPPLDSPATRPTAPSSVLFPPGARHDHRARGSLRRTGRLPRLSVVRRAPTVLRAEDGVTEVWAGSEPPIDPSDLVVERLHAVSTDGAEVGMFVVRRADTALPGPVELYGYGGFTINLTPTYSPARLAFLEAGGIVVVANLRGGSEHGEPWHEQGSLGNKQQVFDDFIACGRHLIDQGIASAETLGIRGGSNGGLLTAATMLQQPDLFGAVITQVPVIDMLRFQHFTAGRFWTVEYGDAADPEAFEWLIEYSPLHNVADDVNYPPLLIMTAESDDRVVPMHSHKFAAEVQFRAGGSSENPLIERVETRAGHGMGKPTAKVIEEAADIYAFLLEHLRP